MKVLMQMEISLTSKNYQMKDLLPICGLFETGLKQNLSFLAQSLSLKPYYQFFNQTLFRPKYRVKRKIMQEYKYYWYVPKKVKYQAYGILFTGIGIRSMSYVTYSSIAFHVELNILERFCSNRPGCIFSKAYFP